MLSRLLRNATALILFSFLCSTPVATAQTEVWSEDMTSTLVEAGWIEQSNDGLLIVAGGKGLMALDNNTGKEVWFNTELKGVMKETYQNIDGLPLFYAEYTPIMGKTRGIIIHSSTGDVLYDTKEDNYRIKTFHLFPQQEMILFEMTREDTRQLLSFSLRTMSAQWVVDLGEIKGLMNKIGNSTTRQSYIDHGPDFTKSGDLLVNIDKMAYCVDGKNGELKWLYEADKTLQAMVYSPRNNSIYLGVKKSNKLTVLDPANGEDITPGKLKLKGTLVDITSDKNGNIVLVETEGFNLIDPASNDFIWKKSYKIEYLDQVIPFEDGFIAVGKDEKDGSISYVDMEGDKIWDTKVKGYVYFASTTKRGVLYISTERSNIISYADGKDVWNKDVKFRSIPAVAFDEPEGKVIIFENKVAYKFDMATGSMDVFAEDVELMNVNKKTPLLAEARASGYLLYTDQHMSLLSKSGKLKYTKDFPQITSTNFASLASFGASMAGVPIDIEGAIENIRILERLSKGVYTESNAYGDGSSNTRVLTGVYLNDSPLFEVTKTRYTNSRNVRDHKFILTKDEASRQLILMVNKDTGEVDKRIELTDKTPQYVVDVIDTRVFLCEHNKKVTCYDMK